MEITLELYDKLWGLDSLQLLVQGHGSHVEERLGKPEGTWWLSGQPHYPNLAHLGRQMGAEQNTPRVAPTCISSRCICSVSS